MFKEREPEFARRRDDESAIEGSVGAALLDTPAEAAAEIDAEPAERRAALPAPAPAECPAPQLEPRAAPPASQRRRTVGPRRGREPRAAPPDAACGGADTKAPLPLQLLAKLGLKQLPGGCLSTTVEWAR